MIKILDPNVVSYIHGIIYRGRFLINYIIIGFISIIIELNIQNQLVNYGLSISLSIIISIAGGIIFAFFGNIFFNFRIPLEKRNQAFKYFIFIFLFTRKLK